MKQKCMSFVYFQAIKENKEIDENEFIEGTRYFPHYIKSFQINIYELFNICMYYSIVHCNTFFCLPKHWNIFSIQNRGRVGKEKLMGEKLNFTNCKKSSLKKSDASIKNSWRGSNGEVFDKELKIDCFISIVPK